MNGLVWKDTTLLRNGLIYVAVFGVVFSLLFSESNVMGIVCPMLFSSLVASSFARAASSLILLEPSKRLYSV